ncbi:peptidoglycan DD-metalloendopeptidase family protein [Allorhizobium undicola]|uniref:peptidoglycan DD-metalloendopeptidase family protein n=1 Tax=Allorhizobium undicola TaxID=78527 RepID=UPI00047FDF21|nr:peptidoglycan DD-metalloendopeptidase family protein [Allorhizobium undicola]
MEKAAQGRFARKATTPHVLILASGERVRHITIRPWMAGLAVGALVVAATAYLGATAYLVMRDNLIGASMARQAQMQYAYEDRISALRAQVDRVTSRQLLDQQVVEDKIEKLLEQQMALSSRTGRLGSLMDRADQSGLSTPQQSSSLLPQDQATSPAAGETTADRADRAFQNVTLSLKTIEQQQMDRIHELTADASGVATRIEDVLSRTGFKVDTPKQGADAAGGPLVDADPHLGFDTSLDGLDTALSRLEAARQTARRMPLSNPAPTTEITSPFGNRTDPLLGRLAMHTGVDFRAPTGGEIKAAGAGTVVSAGYSGGYGNMVEIDHGQGVSTRYGHMSKILVRVGDRVETGGTVGLAGSTGRSTGSHLHYEVRRNGVAVDPMRYVAAGLKLATIIE